MEQGSWDMLESEYNGAFLVHLHGVPDNSEDTTYKISTQKDR